MPLSCLCSSSVSAWLWATFLPGQGSAMFTVYHIDGLKESPASDQ